ESAGDGSDAVPAIALRRTQDILRRSVLERTESGSDRPAIVGFAAETGAEGISALDLAREKARRKGADLLVFNDITGEVFGAADNSVRILDRSGEEVARAEGSKTLVAHAVLDELLPVLPEVP
ncbi:MAG: phosphopantothenoylcysteine decarboxylase, partial [Brachybacterium sp.]|nr:phosphopantothenoylcysteine decarboxylase [Brachybacterium sp.]